MVNSLAICSEEIEYMSHTYRSHLLNRTHTQTHFICRSQALFNTRPYHTVIWVKRCNMCRLFSLNIEKRRRATAAQRWQTMAKKKNSIKIRYICAQTILLHKETERKLQSSSLLALRHLLQAPVGRRKDINIYYMRYSMISTRAQKMANKRFVFIRKT